MADNEAPVSEAAPLNVNEAARNLITEENVAAALKNDKGSEATLKSFEVIDFTAKGDNYACFVTSVKVFYEVGGEDKVITYVVKLNPCSNIESLKSFISKIFIKEGTFYEEFVPKVNAVLKRLDQDPLRVPRCCYASYKPNKEMIFLEDMRSKSFKMFDRMKGIDDAHAILVLEELARLHSASVIAEDSIGNEDLTEKYPFLKDLFLDVKDVDNEALFNQMFVGFVQNGAKIAGKLKEYGNVATYLNDIAPSCMDILREQCVNAEPRFRVVCHGDCWNNNLLFRYDNSGKPVEVCLLDLQINRVGSIALDLNYFFFTSVSGDTRKQGLRSYLSVYHSSFSNVLTAAKKDMKFTVEELHSEYRNKNTFGLIMSLMVTPVVIMESTEVPDFQDVSAENLQEKMEEHRQLLLDSVESSPLLRPRFLDMFDEMLEHGIIKT